MAYNFKLVPKTLTWITINVTYDVLEANAILKDFSNNNESQIVLRGKTDKIFYDMVSFNRYARWGRGGHGIKGSNQVLQYWCPRRYPFSYNQPESTFLHY